MTTDSKRQFYTGKGHAGSIQDQERAYLVSEVASPLAKGVDDLWMQLLDEEGVPEGSVQDRKDDLSYLQLPGTFGNYASTPDSAAVSVTGDIDIRAKVAADDWTPTTVQEIVDKSTTDSSQFSYLFRLNQSVAGTLNFYWSVDGTTLLSAQSTVAVGAADGAIKWVRATLDVDNGAAGRDIKFYTSDDGVTWTQLGSTVTQAGITSIFNGTATLKVGQRGAGSPFTGKIYYAEVRNGIDGPVVAKFDPQGVRFGSTSFQSTTGEVWTINQSGTNKATLVSRP